MKPPLLMSIVGVLVIRASAALAAPEVPAWCQGGDEKPTYDLRTLYSETNPSWALPALVAASCYPDDDLAGQGKALVAARARWSKRLHLTEDDWRDVSAWSHLSRTEQNYTSINVVDRKAPWSSYGPLDQYAAVIDSQLWQVDASYLADALGPKISQLGRLGYVTECLSPAGGRDPAVGWAMCAADMAQLDADKLAAEIRADTRHPITERMAARFAVAEVLAKRDAWTASVAALRAKDPTYGTMFDLAAKAQAAWSTTDARWVALVNELDDARVTGSRRASAGCVDKTWSAWGAVVGAMPAKELASIHIEPGNGFDQQLVTRLMGSADGYLVALALYQCDRAEELDSELANVIGSKLARWPGARGPRTASHTALLTADLKLDDRDARLEFPDVDRNNWLTGTGSGNGYVEGAVADVKVEGEVATITFAKNKVTQTRCTKGHYTSRISHIMDNGTIVYFYECDKEITETIAVEPSPPVSVTARSAAGLKKGMRVVVGSGLALVAYPAKQTVPALVTGVEVK